MTPTETETETPTETPTETAPELTVATQALERLYQAGLSGQAANGLRTSIVALDKHLRRIPKPGEPLPDGSPKWLTSTGRLLRARAGAVARVAWFNARDRSDSPQAFVEPSAEAMVTQICELTRFAVCDRIGFLAAYSWSDGPLPGLAGLSNKLATLRAKAGRTLGMVTNGAMAQEAFSGWRSFDVRCGAYIRREAELSSTLARARLGLRAIIAEAQARVLAVRDDVGLDVLGRALYLFRNPDRAYPPQETTFTVNAVKEMDATEASLMASMPPSPERETAIEATRRLHIGRIEKERANIVAAWAEADKPAVVNFVHGVHLMRSSPELWRPLGEAADTMRSSFPEGFAARWLQAVTEPLVKHAEAVMAVLDGEA